MVIIIDMNEGYCTEVASPCTVNTSRLGRVPELVREISRPVPVPRLQEVVPDRRPDRPLRPQSPGPRH